MCSLIYIMNWSFHKRKKKTFLISFFLQYYYLTGSTATTFLEYIQRNLPEGVAMKVTKVNVFFSETCMYAIYGYMNIKRSSLCLFNFHCLFFNWYMYLYSYTTLFEKFVDCVIFFFFVRTKSCIKAYFLKSSG